MSLEGRILISGGAGTLGRAIIKRATEENWDCEITVFSSDAMKHAKLRQEYPGVTCVVGDIRSYDTLYAAIAGHDIVIHAAATKIIPVSEDNCVDTIEVNVIGSLNVANACIEAGVKQCLMISTDKAAKPINLYGMSKAVMEKVTMEKHKRQSVTDFHLVRYGNVLESNGSVLEVWHRMKEAGEPIGITHKDMTRFWISPKQAVQFVLDAFSCPPGTILVPKMKALGINKMADYVVGEDWPRFELGMRPGEKIHETLLHIDELRHTSNMHDTFKEEVVGYLVYPTGFEVIEQARPAAPFTSDTAEELTKEELFDLLGM